MFCFFLHQFLLTSTLCLSWKTQTTQTTSVIISFIAVKQCLSDESKKWEWALCPHLLLQLLLWGIQVHLLLLLVSVGAVFLTLFGQSFLSNFTLMLPPLGQVFQQLCLLPLEGDVTVSFYLCVHGSIPILWQILENRSQLISVFTMSVWAWWMWALLSWWSYFMRLYLHHWPLHDVTPKQHSVFSQFTAN